MTGADSIASGRPNFSAAAFTFDISAASLISAFRKVLCAAANARTCEASVLFAAAFENTAAADATRDTAGACSSRVRAGAGAAALPRVVAAGSEGVLCSAGLGVESSGFADTDTDMGAGIGVDSLVLFEKRSAIEDTFVTVPKAAPAAADEEEEAVVEAVVEAAVLAPLLVSKRDANEDTIDAAAGSAARAACTRDARSGSSADARPGAARDSICARVCVGEARRAAREGEGRS